MSDELKTISRTPPAHPSMDFARLREEGIAYIADLAGKVWTDYNLHDPGITALEVLLYAITDLGYRTNLPVKDLMTSQEANPLQNFHTLAEVAINCPWTIDDYRKLLRDTDRVRSGWLKVAPSSEVGQALMGLYQAYVELDEDPKLGNLNDNSVNTVLDITNAFAGVPNSLQLEVEFPTWETQFTDVDAVDSTSFTMDVPDLNYLDIPDDPFLLFADIQVNGTVTIPVKIRTLNPQDQIFNITEYINLLKAQFNTHTIVVQRYLEKRALVKSTLKSVTKKLHGNRNLCEDFLSVSPMSLQELALKLRLEVVPGTNLESTLARVYFEVGRFLAPPMRFKTLKALLEEGYRTDQIFEGPLLNNGFIADEELDRQDRRSIIYISDLVQIIMDVPGVVAVRGIGLCNYIYGELTSEIQVHLNDGQQTVDGDLVDDYCLNLNNPERFVPQLSVLRSSASFEVLGQLPASANTAEVIEQYQSLKAIAREDATAGGPRDLPVPEGKWLGLKEYPSIQNDFPNTYGVGPDGLGAEENDQRQAQARQFKGYLRFFDDLMAAYLAQLSELRSLFSMEDATVVGQTYFSPAVVQADDVQSLLAGYTAYALSNGLDPESPTDFQTYLNDTNVPTAQDHQVQLGFLLEDQTTFEDRRNRFLDHLLARFTESFTDYALYLHRSSGSGAPAQLITDKARFLKHYPEMSRERGKGFNYCDTNALGDPNVWDTSNVAGLKKRVSYLMGLANYDRQNWSPLHGFEQYIDTGGQHRFRLWNDSNELLLSSAGGKNTEAELLAELAKVIQYGQDPANYNSLTAQNGTYFFQLVDDSMPVDVIGVKLGFVSASERDAGMDELIAKLRALDNVFGFHLVENLLLRPRKVGDEALLPDESCDDSGCEKVDDPYSFRVNVVLPTWTSQASDPNFRRAFTQTLRLETPAHIYLKFYWVDRVQLFEFERWYKKRLENIAEPEGEVLQDDLLFWLNQEAAPADRNLGRLPDQTGSGNKAFMFTGKSPRTNGTTDYIRGNIGTVNGLDRFTMAIWVRITDFINTPGQASPTDRFIVNLPLNSDFASGTAGTSIFTPAHRRFVFRVHTGASIPDMEHVITENQWIRLVGTFGDGLKRFYINGVLAEEQALPGTIAHLSEELFLGAAHTNNLNQHASFAFYSGLQLWSDTWDADDVLYDYEHPEQLPCYRGGSNLDENNLLLSWLMIEGRGFAIHDASGNQLHGQHTSNYWNRSQFNTAQTAFLNYSAKLWFDRQNNLVTIPDDGGVNNIYNNGAISFLFKRDGDTLLSYQDLYHRFNSSDRGLQLFIDNANNFSIYTDGSLQSFGYQVDLQPHYYRVEINGNQATLSVDDNLISTVTINPVDVPDPATHGMGKWKNVGAANGVIDDVRIEVGGVVTGWWQNNPIDYQWEDLSGNGNHGTFPHTIDVVTLPEVKRTGLDSLGRPVNRLRDGDILNLDGDGHVYFKYEAGRYVMTDDFTMECWIKPNRITNPQAAIMGYGAASSHYHLYLNYNDNSASAISNGFANAQGSDFLLEIGEWVHLVAAFDASTNTMTYYRNGIYGGSYTSNALVSQAQTHFYIGRWSYASSGQVDGNLGDVRLYKGRALSQLEARANFRAQRNKFGL